MQALRAATLATLVAVALGGGSFISSDVDLWMSERVTLDALEMTCGDATSQLIDWKYSACTYNTNGVVEMQEAPAYCNDETTHDDLGTAVGALVDNDVGEAYMFRSSRYVLADYMVGQVSHRYMESCTEGADDLLRTHLSYAASNMRDVSIAVSARFPGNFNKSDPMLYTSDYVHLFQSGLLRSALLYVDIINCEDCTGAQVAQAVTDATSLASDACNILRVGDTVLINDYQLDYLANCYFYEQLKYFSYENNAYTPTLDLSRFEDLSVLHLVNLPVLNQADMTYIGNHYLNTLEWTGMNDMHDTHRNNKSEALCRAVHNMNSTWERCYMDTFQRLLEEPSEWTALALTHSAAPVAFDSDSFCDVSDVVFDMTDVLTLDGFVTGKVRLSTCADTSVLSVAGCNMTASFVGDNESSFASMFVLTWEDLCDDGETYALNDIFAAAPYLQTLIWTDGTVNVDPSSEGMTTGGFCMVDNAVANLTYGDTICGSGCHFMPRRGAGVTDVTCYAESASGNVPDMCSNVPCCSVDLGVQLFDAFVNRTLEAWAPDVTFFANAVYAAVDSYGLPQPYSATYSGDAEAYIAELMFQAYQWYTPAYAMMEAYSRIPSCVTAVLLLEESWLVDLAPLTDHFTNTIVLENVQIDDGSIRLFDALQNVAYSSTHNGYQYSNVWAITSSTGMGVLTGAMNFSSNCIYDTASDSYYPYVPSLAGIYDQWTALEVTMDGLRCEWLHLIGRSIVAVWWSGELSDDCVSPPDFAFMQFNRYLRGMHLHGTVAHPLPLFGIGMGIMADLRPSTLLIYDLTHATVNTTVPAAFQYMYPQLEVLRCSYCALQGEMASIDQLESLTVVDLSFNPDLSGNVGAILSRTTLYDFVNLNGTSITGSITIASHLFCMTTPTVCIMPAGVTLFDCPACVNA